MSLKAVGHRPIIRHRRCGLVNDYDIEPRKLLLVFPERLSNQPFDPISLCGLTTVFFRDRHPEPRDLVFAVPAQHCK